MESQKSSSNPSKTEREINVRDSNDIQVFLLIQNENSIVDLRVAGSGFLSDMLYRAKGQKLVEELPNSPFAVGPGYVTFELTTPLADNLRKFALGMDLIDADELDALVDTLNRMDATDDPGEVLFYSSK
jgi:hypothetical protein